jgi:hypothetical protein
MNELQSSFFWIGSPRQNKGIALFPGYSPIIITFRPVPATSFFPYPPSGVNGVFLISLSLTEKAAMWFEAFFFLLYKNTTNSPNPSRP